jgi:hypothetical protein
MIANTAADAEYDALQELGFVILAATLLVSDSVFDGSADTAS